MLAQQALHETLKQHFPNIVDKSTTGLVAYSKENFLFTNEEKTRFIDRSIARVWRDALSTPYDPDGDPCLRFAYPTKERGWQQLDFLTLDEGNFNMRQYNKQARALHRNGMALYDFLCGKYSSEDVVAMQNPGEHQQTDDSADLIADEISLDELLEDEMAAVQED
jgi:hypothetical protein